MTTPLTLPWQLGQSSSGLGRWQCQGFASSLRRLTRSRKFRGLVSGSAPHSRSGCAAYPVCAVFAGCSVYGRTRRKRLRRLYWAGSSPDTCRNRLGAGHAGEGRSWSGWRQSIPGEIAETQQQAATGRDLAVSSRTWLSRGGTGIAVVVTSRRWGRALLRRSGPQGCSRDGPARSPWGRSHSPLGAAGRAI